MATETVYTTGRPSTNSRINIGAGAIATADGQIAFPDGCSSIKLVGAGSHSDGDGVLLSIDSNGVIRKTGGINTTVNALSAASSPATSTTRGVVYGTTYSDIDPLGGYLSTTYGFGIPPIASDTSYGSTAIGYGVFSSDSFANSIGDTVVGAQTLASYTDGSYNTVVGFAAGTSLITGTRNTFIGHNAGTISGQSAGTNMIALGSGAIVKDSNEFAIAPDVAQIRAEGLSNSAGFMIPLAMSTTGIIKKMPHGLVWGARVVTDYSQAITSGSSTATITNLVVEFGDTSRLLGNAFSVPPGLGYAIDGLWEITAQARVTGNAALTALSLELFQNLSTVVCTWEHTLNSAQWITHGGTRILKLSPGDAVQMRIGWTSSSATTVTVKAVSTYLQVRYLGASGM
jgi:hypothetical protein